MCRFTPTVTNVWIGHVILTWNPTPKDMIQIQECQNKDNVSENFGKKLKRISYNKNFGCTNSLTLFVHFRGFHNSKFRDAFLNQIVLNSVNIQPQLDHLNMCGVFQTFEMMI